MKKIIKLVALAGTVAGAIAGAAYAVNKKKGTEKVEDGLNLGEDVLDKCTGLKDLNNNSIYMGKTRGKRVCMLFWGMWNLPSRKDLIEIEKLHRETEGSDIKVIAVHIGGEVAKVKQFIEVNGYTLQTLVDTEERLIKELGINLVPTYLFINKEGKLVSKMFDTLTTEEIGEELEKTK